MRVRVRKRCSARDERTNWAHYFSKNSGTYNIGTWWVAAVRGVSEGVQALSETICGAGAGAGGVSGVI
jgi:hypothetical protein